MVDPVSLGMMIGSIGLRFHTNNKNNEKARKLQESQRKAQIAAQNKQFKRMRELQAEQARLALELEEEAHKERMADIEKQYDEFVEGIITKTALKNWPLKNLPFIIRNESFGTLISNGYNAITLHCILTPSNCSNFNRQVYPGLDDKLGAEINNNWNLQSAHPVFYHSGGWKKMTSKEDDIHNDIQLLKNRIKGVPCMVISPYFEEKGVSFHVNIWGMGEDTPKFLITPPSSFLSYEDEYKKGINYENFKECGDDILNVTIEEFVPYLECLIGLVADKYFWSIYNMDPILPNILLGKQNKVNSFNLLKKEIIEQYKSIRRSSKQPYSSPSDNTKLLKGYSCLLDDVELEQEFCDLIIDYYNNKTGKGFQSINECFESEFSDKSDLSFLKNTLESFNTNVLREKIQRHIVRIDGDKDIPLLYCSNSNELYQRIYDLSKDYSGKVDKFICKRTSKYYSVGCYVNVENKVMYSSHGDSYYIFSMRNKELSTIATRIDTLKFYKEETSIAFPLFEEEPLFQYLKMKENWLNQLKKVDEKISSYLPNYLSNAPIMNVKYGNLKDWADRNRKGNSSFNIIVGYSTIKNKYYVIGMFDSNEEDFFACYCNTIDDSLSEKLIDKTTIKINF